MKFHLLTLSLLFLFTSCGDIKVGKPADKKNNETSAVWGINAGKDGMKGILFVESETFKNLYGTKFLMCQSDRKLDCFYIYPDGVGPLDFLNKTASSMTRANVIVKFDKDKAKDPKLGSNQQFKSIFISDIAFSNTTGITSILAF